MLYEEILNDLYINELYDNIEKYENNNESWANHSKKHALNVSIIIEKLLLLSKSNKKTIETAKIAALLHDLGCVNGKDKHEIRGYEIAKEYLSKKEISTYRKKEILNAIKNHRNCLNSDNHILNALVLSDKLDITKDRVLKAGYNIKGMRQLINIDDIKITKNGKILKINFITSKNIDLKELNEFYFMDKVYKSIKNYANYYNWFYQICFNDKIYISNFDPEENYWNSQLEIYKKLPYINKYKYLSWQPARWSSNGAAVKRIFDNIKDIETVCEVGAGSMAFSFEMYRQNNNLKLTGVDRSLIAKEYAQKIAKDMNIPMNYYVQDLFDLNENNKYDIVLSLGVIEHYKKEEQIKFINKCKNLSKKYILIAIPNQDSIIFKSYVNWSSKNNNNYEEEHEVLDIKKLKNLVEKCGLKAKIIDGFQIFLSESRFLDETFEKNKDYIKYLKNILTKGSTKLGEKFPHYNFKREDIKNMQNVEYCITSKERLELSFMTYILCEK